MSEPLLAIAMDHSEISSSVYFSIHPSVTGYKDWAPSVSDWGIENPNRERCGQENWSVFEFTTVFCGQADGGGGNKTCTSRLQPRKRITVI